MTEQDTPSAHRSQIGPHDYLWHADFNGFHVQWYTTDESVTPTAGVRLADETGKVLAWNGGRF